MQHSQPTENVSLRVNIMNSLDIMSSQTLKHYLSNKCDFGFREFYITYRYHRIS